MLIFPTAVLGMGASFGGSYGSLLALSVGGATFQARKISADGLDGSNLYELIATLRPDTARHIADYTLIAAGAQFKSGPGFIILTGTGPPGEILLDSTCAAAGGGG